MAALVASSTNAAISDGPGSTRPRRRLHRLHCLPCNERQPLNRAGSRHRDIRRHNLDRSSRTVEQRQASHRGEFRTDRQISARALDRQSPARAGRPGSDGRLSPNENPADLLRTAPATASCANAPQRIQRGPGTRLPVNAPIEQRAPARHLHCHSLRFRRNRWRCL